MIDFRYAAILLAAFAAAPRPAYAQQVIGQRPVDPGTMTEMQAYESLKGDVPIPPHLYIPAVTKFVQSVLAAEKVKFLPNSLKIYGTSFAIIPPPDGFSFPYRPIQYGCVEYTGFVDETNASLQADLNGTMPRDTSSDNEENATLEYIVEIDHSSGEPYMLKYFYGDDMSYARLCEFLDEHRISTNSP